MAPAWFKVKSKFFFEMFLSFRFIFLGGFGVYYPGFGHLTRSRARPIEIGVLVVVPTLRPPPSPA